MTTNNVRVTLTPESAREALSALDNISGVTVVDLDGEPVTFSLRALGLKTLREALFSAMYAEPHDEVAELREALAKVTRERDAYRKAKAENDERFMCERDEARESLAKVTAQRGALEDIVKMLSKYAAQLNDVTDELVDAIRDDRDPEENALRDLREITSMGDAINSAWSEYRRSR